MLSSVQYPATLGSWLPTRRGMECRLPLATVQVDAPKDFLRSLQRLCNGIRTLSEVRAQLSATWNTHEVDQCLEQLIACGALVEASHLCAHEVRRGWLPQRLPRLRATAEQLGEHRDRAQSSRKVTPERTLSRPQASPLVSLIGRRRSARTFGDRPLTQSAVEKILWAVSGQASVVAGEPRRTVPSPGGLYQIEWFVAMLRSAGDIERGLYRVQCHDTDESGAGLGLERLVADVERTWETFLAPALLEYAHLVLYPVADTAYVAEKYGNRSVTLALLEAGHSLQNGALAALEGHADSIVRGDTIETAVLDMLGVPASRMPLPALVVGSSPSDNEVELEQAAAQAVPLRLVPHPVQTPQLRSHLAVAGPIPLTVDASLVEWSSGKSTSARIACIKAEAEAWERIGWATPSRLHYSCMDDLPDAVDPTKLVAYAPRQYRGDFPFCPFSPLQEHAWVSGVNVQTGHSASLLAQCVFAHSALPDRARHHPYTNASTSGMAAGTTADMALSRAVIELIERDAFVRVWARGVAPAQFADATLPGHLFERVRALRLAGFTVTFLHLPSDCLPVVGVFIQKPGAYFTSVTTAAALDLDEALEGALAEGEIRVYSWTSRPTGEPIAWNQVAMAGDHGRYFQTRAGARRADWLCLSSQKTVWDRNQSPRSSGELFDRLWFAGHDIWACDLTPPDAALGQGRQPLHVSRAFVSGMLPLWFGHYATPLGSLHSQRLKPNGRSARAIALHPCT